MSTKISAVEVSKHNSEGDAWIAVNGVVWDVTGFAAKHPGGVEVIQEHFGKDGTEVYNSIHGPGLISKFLGPEKRIGELEQNSSLILPGRPEKQKSSSTLLDLNSIITLSQFEAVAEQLMIDRTWGYVAGATEDSISHRANQEWYQRIFFRPRILKKVKSVDMSVTVLGQRYDLPFFIAPTSSVKLSHPDGELAHARASVAFGVPMIVPTMGSYSFQEIVSALPPGYPFFLQLYMYSDRSDARKFLQSAHKLKPRGILFTVDLPVLSKREVIKRQQPGSKDKNEREVAPPPTNTSLDENIGWEDIAWIRECCPGVPIFLKGIQCAADARRAYEHGCAGIYLSNHGGRALDTAVPAILTLLEIHASCPEVLDKMEVFIDGGIRRGRDILKAICLGASAVLLGRPFLYALSYGEEGAKKAFRILSDELRMAMQLVGITSLDQAHPGLLNTADIDRFVYAGDAHPWARKVERSKL
ncbi:L-lactate dehydrogenase [Xylogone sp. PMI_703]|nr:L-lactate dehydrogenase [Xylogone sp. PMI_703]